MSLGGVAEISNIVGSDPKHYNGTVVTAGTPVTITAPDSKNIVFIVLKNPIKGPNSNPYNKVLLFSIDGGTTYMSLVRGETLGFPGNAANLKIDATVDGTSYEAVIWSTPEE